MIKYFVEISKDDTNAGKSLWSPVNKGVWHWKILKDLRKWDTVYHISTKERPPRLIGKSVVKSSAKENKTILGGYSNYKKGWEVELFNHKKEKNPIVFDKAFENKLRRINFSKTKSPFNIHYSLNQIYCCEIGKELRDFFEDEMSIS